MPTLSIDGVISILRNALSKKFSLLFNDLSYYRNLLTSGTRLSLRASEYSFWFAHLFAPYIQKQTPQFLIAPAIVRDTLLRIFCNSFWRCIFNY